jgi:hypothetical protein
MQANDADRWAGDDEQKVRLLLQDSLRPLREVGPNELIDESPNDVEEMAPPEPKPAPRSPIKKIIWPQVGRVKEPGRYMFRFGFLTITAEDLSIWRDHPTAAFTLVRIVTADDMDEFRLGIFELHDDLSISEK